MDAGALALPPPIVPALGAGIAARPRSMREAAEEFEAVFLSRMLAPVFEQLGDDPLMGGGQAGRIYQGLLVDELGRAMAKAGGIGLADAVYRELVKAQAAAHGDGRGNDAASTAGGLPAGSDDMSPGPAVERKDGPVPGDREKRS